MNLKIIPATQAHMPQIIHGIKQLSLDDLDLKPEQFIVAVSGTTVIGFGRLKVYDDVLELCSLGVLPESRGKGLSRKLMEELIKRSEQKIIYVVSIIPEFFKRFGFEETKIYPQSLNSKLNYCSTLGASSETHGYVVMRLKQQ